MSVCRHTVARKYSGVLGSKCWRG